MLQGIGNERLKKIPFAVKLADCNDPNAVLNKWGSDFRMLLNPKDTTDTSNSNNKTFDCSASDGNIDEDSVFGRIIHIKEVLKCILAAKSGKAPGYDQIPSELLKNDGALVMLHSLYNRCFITGIVPSAWSKGIISPIPKSSTADQRDPISYRGITLAPTMYKIYCSVLNNRIAQWCSIENVIHDEQNGFIKGNSTIDHVHALTNVIETRKLKKLSTFTAFIDYRKAYDMIDRAVLFEKLRHEGLQGSLLQAMTSLYSDVKCCVRINGFDSEWFDVKYGLKQGCPLSPVLFNLYINDLISFLTNLGVGIDIDDQKVRILLFADDVVLLAENAVGLQLLLDSLSAWCSRNKMQVNCEKSKIVHFRPKSILKTEHVFIIAGMNLEIVQCYKYLGVI